MSKSPAYRAGIQFTTILISVTVASLCFVLWRDRWYADAIGGAEAQIAFQQIFKAIYRAEGGNP